MNIMVFMVQKGLFSNDNLGNICGLWKGGVMGQREGLRDYGNTGLRWGDNNGDGVMLSDTNITRAYQRIVIL
jgi:hypothetical protein